MVPLHLSTLSRCLKFPFPLHLISSPLLFLRCRVASSFPSFHLVPFSLITHFLFTVVSAGSPSWSSSMTSMRRTCRRRSTSTGRRESQTPESTAAYTSSRQLDTGEDALKLSKNEARAKNKRSSKLYPSSESVCSGQFTVLNGIFWAPERKKSPQMFFKAVSFNLIYYLALQVLKSQH